MRRALAFGQAFLTQQRGLTSRFRSLTGHPRTRALLGFQRDIEDAVPSAVHQPSAREAMHTTADGTPRVDTSRNHARPWEGGREAPRKPDAHEIAADIDVRCVGGQQKHLAHEAKGRVERDTSPVPRNTSITRAIALVERLLGAGAAYAAAMVDAVPSTSWGDYRGQRNLSHRECTQSPPLRLRRCEPARRPCPGRRS